MCGDCIAIAHKIISADSADRPVESLHPATEEFLQRFLAFREQLEADHESAADHVAWEKDLEQLEAALSRLRARLVSKSEV
jgi:hypothetical protein